MILLVLAISGYTDQKKSTENKVCQMPWYHKFIDTVCVLTITVRACRIKEFKKESRSLNCVYLTGFKSSFPIKASTLPSPPPPPGLGTVAAKPPPGFTRIPLNSNVVEPTPTTLNQ